MAETVGKILEILEIPEVLNLYQTSIRKMQPAEIVRRLRNEKVSTRGHMPELRGRLLRLEVQKSHPRVQVPWYPEDDVSEEIVAEEQVKPSNEQHMDVLRTKFFELAQCYEEESQRNQDALSMEDKPVVFSNKVIEKPQIASEENPAVQKQVRRPFHTVLERLESAVQAHIATQWENLLENYQQKQSPKLTDEHSTIKESEFIFDENLDDKDEASSMIFDSDGSIVEINLDHVSFEKLTDEESIRTWEMDKCCCDSSSPCTRRMAEVD